MNHRKQAVTQPDCLSRLRTLSAALASVAIVCTSAHAADLNAPAQRSSDQAIVADQAAYTAWQGRIKALNDKGVRVADYYLAKAQCWLDVSLHEYTRNDRSNFPQQALTQSALIVQALEAGSTPNPGAQTPLVNEAEKLREDLWARFAAIKPLPGFACAAKAVACGEVELVHAGNEYKQQGWRHANPYVQIAEDLVQQATTAAANCNPPVPAPAPVPACQPAVCPAPPKPPVTEMLTLSADALFKFDKSGLPDLLPEGRAKIDDMMAKLDKAYVSIERISLTGFTDRLGSVPYNQALSKRRAATVKAYLQSRGFKGEIVSNGKGKADQLVPCTGVTPHAKLIACLQPNRRVEIAVTGVKR
jgi:outer membrane protein OmpA-like peptidoglycan-associated protein